MEGIFDKHHQHSRVLDTGTLDNFNEQPLANTARKLKVDFVVQTILLCLTLAGIILQIFALGFFSFYFGIGAYQLVTSFIHLRFKKHSLVRILYWPQLVIHAGCFLSLNFLRDPIEMLLIILFTTAFSGLYYYILTAIEYAKTRR